MSKNDIMIKKLLGTIEEKRTKLGTKPRMSLKTNGLFMFENKQVNINTISLLNDCIVMVAEFIYLRDSYTKAIKELEIEILKAPKHFGYSIEEWIEDFKLKAKIIQWKTEDTNIKNLESKLKNLRSEDLKTSDALDDIAAALK